MTFEEILAPVHQQVKISGVTEEELENLFESAREEVWQEKKEVTQCEPGTAAT